MIFFLKSTLETPRVAQKSAISEALWDPEKGQAVVTKPCGKHWDVVGQVLDNQIHLNPEEALFLLGKNLKPFNYQGFIGFLFQKI